MNSKSLIAFMIIILFVDGLNVNTQESSPFAFGGKYTVRKGDNENYKYTKLYPKGYDFGTTILLENGSEINYDPNLNLLLTVQVVNITKTMNDIEQVYTREIVSLSNTKFISSVSITNTFPPFIFIQPSFDNVPSLKSYLDANFGNYSSKKGFWPSFSTEITYKISGDYYTINETAPYTVEFKELTIITCYNWKTGWLEYYDKQQKDSKGIIYLELALENIHSNNFQKFLSNHIVITTVLVTTLIVLTTIGFYYVKYTNEHKKNRENKSFSSYLSNKIGIKKKKRERSHHEIDLKKIEEILEENEQIND